jgi:hypothetical protein
LPDDPLVDDAQDIRRDLFTSLRKLLRDRRNGLLYAFYDPALQDISSDWNPSCISSRLDLLLPDNCRNTEFIYRLVMEYYPGDEMPVSRGPQGRQVLCADPAQMKLGKDGDAELATVAQVISKLVIRGVKSDDILIITGRNRATSRWQPGVKAGIYSIVWYPQVAEAAAISVIAAADAKAIESPVVVLTELDGLDDNPRRDVILYQALSRAQLHLVVVGNKDDIMPE